MLVVNLNLDCVIDYFITIFKITFGMYFSAFCLFAILPHQLFKVEFYYTHFKWNAPHFMINPSEYAFVGLGSSSFIMHQERLASLSNKGIHSKSGTSEVQFLTLCLYFSPSPWLKLHPSSVLLVLSHTEASQSPPCQEQAHSIHGAWDCSTGGSMSTTLASQFEFVTFLPGRLCKAQYIDFS